MPPTDGMTLQFHPRKRGSKNYIESQNIFGHAHVRGEEGSLSAQLHKSGGEGRDLSDGAQDVIPLLGVFT